MKRYQFTIIKDGQRLDSLMCTESEFSDWLKIRVDHKVFGAEAYDEQVLVSEAIPAVYEDQEFLVSEAVEAKDAVLAEDGTILEEAVEAQEAVYETRSVLISPEIPAKYETIHHPAEYEIEKIPVDEVALAAQIQQEQINAEAEAYLRETDWMVLRHIRQKSLGQELSLSEEDYLELEQSRAEAAERVVR